MFKFFFKELFIIWITKINNFCVGIEIYQQLLFEKEKKAQQPTMQPLFEEVKKLLISTFIQCTLEAFVYKLFGVKGTFLISIFGSAFNVKDNIFSRDAKVIIGEANIQI